jgi:hypothetical protein
MSRRTKKQPIVKVRMEIHAGHACGNCGKRYINPFRHTCRITASGKPRNARKPSKKKSWR